MASFPHHMNRGLLPEVMLSLAICAVVAFPWPTPSPEVVVREFIPERISVDYRGFLKRPGRIRVSPQEIALLALPSSQPTVHLLTAEVPFTATFDVAVQRQHGRVFPFQVKVWSPRIGAGLEAWFGPDGTISAGTQARDRRRVIASFGTFGRDEVSSWRVSRDTRAVTIERWAGGRSSRVRVTREMLPELFADRSLSLTIYASALETGASAAVVRNPVFTVPRQVLYGSIVRSGWYRGSVLLVTLLSLIWVTTQGGFRSALGSVWKLLRPARLAGRRPEIVVVLSLASIVAVLGVLLSTLPGYPYDVRSFRVWGRIAREHGPAAVPGASLLATPGDSQGGQPYAAVTYPYPPLPLYLSWLAARLAPAARFEGILKALFTLSVLAGGIGAFVLLRHLRIPLAAATIAAGAYVVNPAILFDSTVWGQMDAYLAISLLVGTAGLLVRSATLLWIGLFLAVLTKQTGAVFAPIFVLMGAARVGFWPMVRRLPRSVIITFLIVAPLLLAGIGPNIIYRPLITKILDFGTVRHTDVANAVVSQSAFTLWSAVAGVEGDSGWARLARPDYLPSRLGPSYFALSRAAFILFLLVLGYLLFQKRRMITVGDILLALAAYGVGIAILLTRVHARYLYFGLMFTSFSLPWMPRWLWGLVMAILSVTMLLSMWGSFVFTSIWYPGLVPQFAPERSWFNRAAAASLGSDLGITVGGLLNVGALLILLWALWQTTHVISPPRRKPSHVEEK